MERLQFIHRKVPELIHDQQCWLGVSGQLLLQSPARLGGAQRIDDVHCRCEQDAVPLQTGPVAQGRGQMGFAHPHITNEDDIAGGGLLHELQAEQILNYSAINGFGP